MKRIKIIFAFLIVISCESKQNQPASIDSIHTLKTEPQQLSWLQLRDSFPFKNLTEFKIDSTIWEPQAYNKFYKLNNHQIDTIINRQNSYLYSWQERNSGFNEFTILSTDEVRGYSIFYFQTTSADSIMTAEKVAMLNGEDGVGWESRSKFIHPDTMWSFGAISTNDIRKGPQPYKKLPRSMGDSTFYKLYFNKKGKLLRKKIGEKNELNIYK